MPKYKVTVHELLDQPNIDVRMTDAPATSPTDRQVFFLVIDQFEPVAFVRALCPTTRKRRKGAKEEKGGAKE